MIIKESQLRAMIAEAIMEELGENCQDEDIINQTKTGFNTLFGKGQEGNSLRQRWDNAKKNYQTQGKVDDLQKVIDGLSALLDARKINPQTTVAQLVGGKYNNGKFGTMSGMANNMKGQMMRRGYAAKEE